MMDKDKHHEKEDEEHSGSRPVKVEIMVFVYS